MVHMVQNRNIEFEVILALVKNRMHLRELARAIKVPHSTLLRKLNELFKDGLIDYKIEGKNKIFFIKNNLSAKNYVYSAEFYKLNKLLKRHSELAIIFEDIKKSFPEGMIILFGSYAKDAEKPNSDIDIYLETTNFRIKDKIKEIYSKLSIKTGEFNLNSLLVREIIKNHIIISGVEGFYERINFFKET